MQSQAQVILPRERFDDSPTDQRSVRPMPNGARIAVWTVVNVEDWEIKRAMPRQVHRPSAEWPSRCRDTFDRLYAEGSTRPRVMAMAVHPYVSGVPHRIAAFEAGYDYIAQHSDVWMATGDEICDWSLRASS